MDNKPTILIVDDDPKFRKTLSDILRAKGYRAIAAAKGKTALDRVKEEMPAVALIDLKLPDMDGLKVMREIKKRSPDTECIVLTGHASQASVIEAVNLGAYGYMQKPYDMEQLVATIRRAIEKREAEEVLRKSEERYRTILDDIEDGYFEVDIAGNFTFFNDSLCRIIGYSRDEMMGMNNRHYMDKENAKKMFQAFNRVYTTGKPTKGFDWEIIRKDGTRRFVEASASPIRGSEGEPIGFRGIVRDITERKRAEEALKASEEHYRSLFDGVPVGLYRATPDGQNLDANPAAIEMLGYPDLESLQAVDLADLYVVDPQERKRWQALMEREGVILDFEAQLRRRDGTVIWVRDNARAVRDADGRVLYYEGSLEDITQRKRAEEEISHRAQQLALINEVGQRIAPILELNELYQTVVEAVQEKFGYQYVVIFSVRDDEVALEAIAGPEAKLMPPGYTQKVGEGMVGWVAQTGETLLANDVTKEPRFLLLEFLDIAAELDVPIRLGGKTIGVLLVDSDRPDTFYKADVTTLETIAGQVARAIENAQAYQSLRDQNLQTIAALAAAVEAKDPYTSGHSEKVTQFAITIAEKMGLSHDEIEDLRVAGLLHDIGKIGIPDSVLNKPVRLTPAEFLMIKVHPVIAAEIVGRIEALTHLVPIIRYHHERWDGTGYPDGLKGDETPLLARILAVADGFEAMTAERPYRRARTEEEALAELEKGAGSQWDSQVVEVFVKIYEERAPKH